LITLRVIPKRATLFVLLAAAIAFAPSIAGSFHLDDYSLLGDPAFTTFGGWAELLQPARVRPLASLTLWANYQLHEDSAWGYHLVNLLLHLCAIWLASDALQKLLPPMAAWAALIVFALHPLQTEPVAYVFARSTLLCGLFAWGAIAAWLRERRWLAVFLTAAALLAKEEAVALPIFFALFFGSRRNWPPIAAMFGLALAAGLRGLWATSQGKGSGAGLDVAISPFTYALSQGSVIVRYLRLLFFPVGFNFDPDLDPALWISLLSWCALGAAVMLLKPPARLWFAAGLIFLAPTSSFLPIDDLSADRRMYLAAPCFAAALALLWSGLKPRYLMALALFLATLTFARALVFRTEESLWRDTVAGSPAKVRPRIQLARAVAPAEAIDVMANLPADGRVSAERGRAYMELGRPAEALREFGVALAAEPGDPRALANRGTALAALGQTDAARQDFARALALDPCLYPALVNLRQLGVPLPALSRCRFTADQNARLGLR